MKENYERTLEGTAFLVDAAKRDKETKRSGNATNAQTKSTPFHADLAAVSLDKL